MQLQLLIKPIGAADAAINSNTSASGLLQAQAAPKINLWHTASLIQRWLLAHM